MPGFKGLTGWFSGSVYQITDALTYQNLRFCRVPINSILGFIIRTYKKVGFGRLRWGLGFRGLGSFAEAWVLEATAACRVFLLSFWGHSG